MSKNVFGIAISTATLPRGYPSCSNSPRSATCFQVSPAARRLGSPLPILPSPRTAASPRLPAPSQRYAESPLAPREGRVRHSDIGTAAELSPTEDTSFLPRTPLLVTPSLTQQPRHIETNKLGTFSAINIILGKTIGVGIFSVPASIYADVGSVGMTLVVWSVAAIISFCGLAVYLDLGTALPQSGGEKVYLERIFRRPRFLATCMLMSYAVLLGFSAPNCIVLGEYLMYALDVAPNRWNVRTVAVLAVTLACALHARLPRVGLRLINVLGVVKLLIIATIILGGLASIPLRLGGDPDDSTSSATFGRNFSAPFAATTAQPHALATAVLKALYCFRGYSSANQVLSEVRRPARTLSRAAPTALAIVAAAYLLTNIAYFCAVDASDLAAADLVAAGRFFERVFGPLLGARLLPLLVVPAAFGSVAATSFAQARVNREFARDGLVPFARLVGRANGRGAPAAGLLLHWLVSVAVIVLPPPGPVYAFLVELGGYPVSVISVVVAAGLLYLQLSPRERWRSPRPASKIATVLFLLSNMVLLVLPWIRPREEAPEEARDRFPYYAYPAAGLGVLGLGAVYWIWWSRVRGWWEALEERIIVSQVRLGDEQFKEWKKGLVHGGEGL